MAVNILKYTRDIDPETNVASVDLDAIADDLRAMIDILSKATTDEDGEQAEVVETLASALDEVLDLGPADE